MTVQELAEIQAGTVALMVTAVPGGRTVTCAGVLGARSGLPHPLANGFVVSHGDSPDDLAPALSLLAGLPYAGQLAADRHPRTVAALADAGHRPVETSAAMVCRPETLRPPVAPDLLSVRPVRGGDPMVAAWHLAAEVFGVPATVMAMPFATDVVTADHTRTWVGEVDRETVTCAQTFRFGPAGLLVNVATAGAHRRHGYAAAVSAAATAELFARGCRRVWLVATRAGSGVYQDLGFRTAGAWQTWLSPGTGAG